MTKMKFISYLLFASLLFTCYSCESNNDANYSIEGQWKVLERRFDCPDDPTLAKWVNNMVQQQKEELQNNEWQYLLFTNNANYKEGYKVWEKIKDDTGHTIDSILIDRKKFTGFYDFKDDKNINITIGNIGSTWQYVLHIADINTEFIYTEQEMDKKSIEIFLERYLNFPHTVEQGLTATWKTKASKVKE